MDLNPNEVFIPLASEKEINLSKCAVHEFDTGRELVFDRELSEDAVVEYDCKIHSQYRTAVEKNPPTKDVYNVSFPSRNLLDLSNRRVITSGTYDAATPRDFSEPSYYIGIAASNYFNPNQITSYDIDGNTITVTSKGGGYGIGVTCEVQANTQYSFTYRQRKNTYIAYAFYDEDGVFLSYIIVDAITKYAFTTPADCKYMMIILRPAANVERTFTDMQLELGLYETPYAVYGGTATCYSGTLDVVSGTFTMNKGYAKFDHNGEWVNVGGSYPQAYQIETVISNAKQNRAYADQPNYNYSNKYPWSSHDAEQVGIRFQWMVDSQTSGRGRMFVYDAGHSADLAGFLASLQATPLEIVYEYLVPVTIQLTPTEVQTLLNENVLTSDADGMSVTYRNTAGQYVTVPPSSMTDEPIVIHDGARNMPVQSLAVAMSPKQNLNGYSKPWAGGCGKNKIDSSIKYQQSSQIVAIGGSYSQFYLSLPAGEYTFSVNFDKMPYYLYYREESGSANVSILLGSTTSPTTSKTITLGGGVYRFWAYRSDADGGVDIDHIIWMQIEAGSPATAYEPYENICPITGTSEITVKNEGKNLFSKQDFYVSGGSIYLGKSSSQDKYSVYIPEEGTYTFSIGFKEVVSDTTGFTICQTEYDPSSWITPTTCLAYTGWYVGKYFSVSMRFAGGKYYTLSFERESLQNWEANPPVDFFMLEYGDTASKYWKTSTPLLDVMLNEHCHGDVYGHVVNYEELTRRYVTYDFKIPVIRRLMNDLEPLKPLKYEVSVKNKDKYSITPTVVSTKDDNFKLIDTFTSKASYKPIDTGKMKVCEINIGAQVGDTLSVTAYGEIESRIPDAYQEVEYIQSTGYEWIDTGINSKDYAQKIKIELDMQISGGHDTSMWPTQGVGNFAQANGSAWGYYMMYPTYKWTINGTSQWHFFMSMGETNPAITGSDVYWHDFGAVDTNRHTFVLDAYNGIFAMDSTEVTGKASKALDSDNYGSYPLFVIKNNDGYKPNTFQKNKLYSCKMTDMSEQKVLREFVPCYRKQDNVAGLYDLVSKTFFVNQGTGAFLKGSNVYPKPIYKNLISDGTYVYTVSGGALSASIGELANLTGSMFDTYGFASLADCTTAESDIMALSRFQIMRWCESAKDFSVMTATATIAGPSAIIDTDVLDLEGKGVVGMESVSQVSNSSTMECYFDFGVNDLWYYDTTDNEWYALGESGTKGFMTPADMALIPVDKWEEKIATADKFAIKCIIEDVGDYITSIKFNFKMRSTRPQINE